MNEISVELLIDKFHLWAYLLAFEFIENSQLIKILSEMREELKVMGQENRKIKDELRAMKKEGVEIKKELKELKDEGIFECHLILFNHNLT